MALLSPSSTAPQLPFSQRAGSLESSGCPPHYAVESGHWCTETLPYRVPCVAVLCGALPLALPPVSVDCVFDARFVLAGR
jgi:hypothetical protein